MSEQADNMLESPMHHRLNHHGSNNGNLLLEQEQQQDEITQLGNVQTDDNEETTNDLNNINNSFGHNNSVPTTSSVVVTSAQPQSTSSAASTTATMAALATANAIAVARAAAAAAAAAQAAMNSVSNSNSNTSTSTMNSSGLTSTHQQQPNTTRRNANNMNHSNLTNSIINNNTTTANNVGAGNNDGNHLSTHRVTHKSKDYHHQHQHHHNSSTRQNDENIDNMVVEDEIIRESGGGDEENVMIGHASANETTGEDDEFQLQLHHHNMLVHENEIEIGNVVEHESMQHHDEVIIGGAHPIVMKSESGDHDLSGTTVTLVSADGLQQQQLHHITVSGRESHSGLNNGPGQDGTRQTSHNQHHGSNIITIPMVGSIPYTVISDSDPFKMNAESGIILQSHSTPVDGCDGYCCQYKKSRDENGTSSSRSSTSATQDPLQTTPPRSSNHTPQQSRLSNTNSTSSSSTSSLFCNSHLTWEEAVSAPILPVRCKDTNAELYKNKFGSGNKGKCIKSGDDWFTPTEFEALCGRGNSKDWKRSIRFGGRTLQTLIDKGFLVPHASSCICSNCVDDATATGPIRPFTPYQRKRKSQSGDPPMKQTKLERLTSKDSNTDESSDVGTPAPNIITGLNLNPLTQALMKVNQMNLPSSNDDAWKVLEEGVEQIVTAAGTLKNLVQEMKERTTQETEELRSQLQNSLHTAVQSSVVGHPQILRIFDNNRIQTYSIEVLDPDSFSPMQENATTSTKCDNCGREGSLECSGCHAVHYCSSFCQKKDWPTHQAACQDRGHQLKEEVL